ncbi:MAG: plastocyanin/azurin family copper-binding protein [Halobacterium sp.]
MTGDCNRRSWLKRVGVVTSALALPAIAGCSSGTGGSSTTTEESSSGDSGGSDGGQTWTKTSTVKMTGSLTFDPDHVKVDAGTTVTWKNASGIGHTVTAYEDELPDGASYFASGGFDSEKAANDGYSNDKSGLVSKGDSFTHEFQTKGTYKYYCIPHEMNGMVGYVKVV